MGSRAATVVFANLDGTCLDPYFDTFGAIASLFAPFVRGCVPVVFLSSRTAAELRVIQRRLGLRHPFAAENGGALFVPKGYFGCDVPGSRAVGEHEIVRYGRPYKEVVKTLRSCTRRLGISVVGVHETHAEDLAADCGLSLAQATLAKLREYSELYRVTDGDVDAPGKLMHSLQESGMRCLDTGRYTHLSAGVDQGLIVDLLLDFYRRTLKPEFTVGIGDPLADLPLLRRVDIPIVATPGALLRAAAAWSTDLAGASVRRTDALLDVVKTLRDGSCGRRSGIAP